jgi:hypothetical protein
MQFDAKRERRKQSKPKLGKRDAVPFKSGVQVDHSCPVLKRPTLSPRAGRKPDACPAVSQGAQLAPCASAQSGRGLGQSPISAEGAVPCRLDSSDIQALLDYILLLDSWERKLYAEKTM